jgi:hypothetical protein
MPGTIDCDGNPNNGCECSTPSCCGATCQTTHSNGLGQLYYDCAPLGVPGLPATYTPVMATEARNAWPFAGIDSTGTCGMGMNGSTCLARQTATSCAVWCYTKSLAGRVHLNTASTTCPCPTTLDPTWD